MIKRDSSGKSKGYGFIRYANYESQEQVLRKQHYIEGRRCEVKIPHSKEEPRGSNKIFVGRITESMTREDLRSYFEGFGDVDDVFIPSPFRSFAFVTFRESDVAQKLVGENHVINGVSVYINNADPKGSKDQGRLGGPSMQSPAFHHGGRGVPPTDNSRYFANAGANGSGSPSFDLRPPQQFTNPINQASYSGGPPNFSAVNPAFLAAALESWNTMVTGMLAGAQGRSLSNPGGVPGENWQNNDSMKKDHRGANWGGGKGDPKWS